MRIALFVNSAKTFFWHREALADRLVELGHELTVVCAKDGDYSKFEGKAYKVILIDLNRKGINPLLELISIIKLIRVFVALKPDVCHNFTIKCVIYGSVAQKFAGVPKIINTITGLGHVFIKGGWLQKVVERLYQIAILTSGAEIIFQNKTDMNLFLDKRLVRKNKAHLVSGSGVDTKLIQPTAKPKSGMPVVLVAARILRSKGVMEILEASLKISHHELWLAGDHDPMNPDSLSEQDLQPFRKYPHIKFLGNANIPELLKRTTVGCLPSYREGMPKFLLECAAAGVPIVTTDTPGCRDVVDGNGFLVPVKSVDELASRVDELLKNSEKAERMGRRSRELAEERFSLDKILKQIIALYA